MTTSWDRRPRLVEDVLGKDGEVRKAGWLDEARLPKWTAKEVRDKCRALLLRNKEMTQTAFLKECGGESAARYAKFSKAPNKENGIYYAALVFFADRENAIRAPWTEDELDAAREVARRAAEKDEAKQKRLEQQVCKCGAKTHARPSSALCPLNKKNALKCMCEPWPAACDCGKREAQRARELASCPCESQSACVCGLGKREAAQRMAWYNAVGRKEEAARRFRVEAAAARLTNKAAKEAGKKQQQSQPKSASAAAAAATVVVEGQQTPWSKRKLPDLTGPMRKGARKAAVQRLALSDDL